MFLFGLIVGSFLNVLIYRLPREISIVVPRSFCTNCKRTIPWYENIPLFSFLFLKGKCRVCGVRIPWCYPLVELTTGLVACLLIPSQWNLENILVFIFYFYIFCAFFVHFIIDIKHRILPNSINIFLALLFFAHSIIMRDWIWWTSGAVIGCGIPLLVTWLFYLSTKKVGLGGGDIKLYGALGLYLGPLGVVHTITFSCFLGAILGGLWILISKKGKNEPFAFGPFIIIVAFCQIFFPEQFARVLFFL